MNQCSVGILCNTDCHKKAYPTQKQLLFATASLPEDDRQLLELRVNAECNAETELETVCMFHKYKFLDAYSASYRTSSDVLHIHRKLVHKTLRTISFDWYQKFKRCLLYTSPSPRDA